MKVPNYHAPGRYRQLSLSRLQNEGSQREPAVFFSERKSIKATE